MNLSAHQFEQPDLVDQVAAVLAETGLAPSQLTLEITESAVMVDIEATSDWLRALKALGVRLALDDFGTGYSSLSYARRLVVDTLKIDRSFVQALEADARNLAILPAITTLAHTLGMDVTAEGIETAEQAARVGSVGRDRGQGYHFARPLSPAAFAAFLDANRSDAATVDAA